MKRLSESRILTALAVLLSVLCLGSMSACAQEEEPAKADSQKLFNAETFSLDNGMQIVVIPNHRAPVVTHMVWYKTGAADEPRGKSGIAHFLEHLMFKGSEGLAPGEFSRKVKSLGGQDNAFTSQDYTAFYQSVAAQDLETVMKMESGRIRGLNPPLEEVESERQVIIEERRQRTDNDPAMRFNEQMDAALYVNHPYGTPVIGWMHEAHALSWDDAKAFYDTHYGPNNAILVVSGDVTGAQVYELARKIYGPLQKIDVPQRHWTSSPPLEATVELRSENPVIRQPRIVSSYRVPSARQNKDDALALEILQEIMGGGPTSRLYKSLAVEQKLVSNIGLYYQPQKWSDTEVNIYASPLPGVELDQVRSAYENELRTLIKDGVSAEELSEAKTRMQDSATYALDSLQGPAMVFGMGLVTGSSMDDIEYWNRDIEGVSAESVQAVAAKYLNPDAPDDNPPVVGYLLPKKQKTQEAQP